MGIYMQYSKIFITACNRLHVPEGDTMVSAQNSSYFTLCGVVAATFFHKGVELCRSSVDLPDNVVKFGRVTPLFEVGYDLFGHLAVLLVFLCHGGLGRISPDLDFPRLRNIYIKQIYLERSGHNCLRSVGCPGTVRGGYIPWCCNNDYFGLFCVIREGKVIPVCHSWIIWVKCCHTIPSLIIS